MEQAEIINRIETFLEIDGSSASSLAKAAGIDTGNMTKMLAGKQKITDGTLRKLSAAHDINFEWLKYGEGDMQIIHQSDAVEKVIDIQGVPLFDVDAAANLQTLFTNKSQNIIGQISIPNVPKCDGALYVRGDSMYPLLKSGDIVAFKQIQLDLRYIHYGEMYLVSIDEDGDEYLVVKYVNKSDIPGCVQLVSYNTHHQPKDVELASIRAMALIKFSIRMNTMR